MARKKPEHMFNTVDQSAARSAMVLARDARSYTRPAHSSPAHLHLRQTPEAHNPANAARALSSSLSPTWHNQGTQSHTYGRHGRHPPACLFACSSRPTDPSTPAHPQVRSDGPVSLTIDFFKSVVLIALYALLVHLFLGNIGIINKWNGYILWDVEAYRTKGSVHFTYMVMFLEIFAWDTAFGKTCMEVVKYVDANWIGCNWGRGLLLAEKQTYFVVFVTVLLADQHYLYNIYLRQTSPLCNNFGCDDPVGPLSDL
jgi:hypothetical protein